MLKKILFPRELLNSVEVFQHVSGIKSLSTAALRLASIGYTHFYQTATNREEEVNKRKRVKKYLVLPTKVLGPINAYRDTVKLRYFTDALIDLIKMGLEQVDLGQAPDSDVDSVESLELEEGADEQGTP